MASITDIDESRRRFLLYMLATGGLTSLAACAGRGLPGEMPPGRSMYQFVGDVKVNGTPVTETTQITSGDAVETGERSYAIFVVDKDAFIVRSNTLLNLAPPPDPTDINPTRFTLPEGRVLSVLASRRTKIRTPSATIGIRGTGVYLEADPEQSYVCTCYGTADLTSNDDINIAETIVSEHHDAPRYVTSEPGKPPRIDPAPFKNHDDQELLLIETLVGRETPYVVPQGLRRSRSSYM